MSTLLRGIASISIAAAIGVGGIFGAGTAMASPISSGIGQPLDHHGGGGGGGHHGGGGWNGGGHGNYGHSGHYRTMGNGWAPPQGLGWGSPYGGGFLALAATTVGLVWVVVDQFVPQGCNPYWGSDGYWGY